MCNRTVKYVKLHEDRGLTCRAGIVITDASFGDEIDQLTGEKLKNQGAKAYGLATPELWDGTTASVHVTLLSKTLRQVCRSTVQCETHHMLLGAKELDTFRAAVVDVKEKLDQKD